MGLQLGETRGEKGNKMCGCLTATVIAILFTHGNVSNLTHRGSYSGRSAWFKLISLFPWENSHGCNQSFCFRK